MTPPALRLLPAVAEVPTVRSGLHLRVITEDFPDGPMVKNPPASAGDVGLIPDPGRFHMPQSNEAHVPQPLSLGFRAQGTATEEAACARACALQQAKPLQ